MECAIISMCGFVYYKNGSLDQCFSGVATIHFHE